MRSTRNSAVRSSVGVDAKSRSCGGTDQLTEYEFTRVQGQYLAFIVAYAKLNRRPPAETDFQRYFEVTPPSVHNMIVTL